MHGEEYSSDRALIDLLVNLNMFMSLIIIVLLMISVITTVKKKDGVELKAEYLVNGEYDGVPHIPNDVFTTSLVMGF